MNTPDRDLPVRRLQFNRLLRTFEAAPKKPLFLRGPIPLEWLSAAASLPGKGLHVAIALWWLHGMAKDGPFKLTREALRTMNVERDAESAGLARLEKEKLIRVERKPGRRPTILILNPLEKQITGQR